MLLDLQRRYKTLVKHEWSLMDDINWQCGIDLEKRFLALSSEFESTGKLTAAESLAVSQILGIMAMSAIAEHEKVLETFKESYWRPLMQKNNSEEGLTQLGEQFFKEEKKHAAAFTKYIEQFANQTNVTMEEISQFIPQYEDNSMFSKLFRWNLKIGGQALWWAIAATEAESISLYTTIKKSEADIDPLYTQIHKLHFEEELRHKCYAFLMLDLNKVSEEKNFFKRTILKLDFAFSHLLEVSWAMLQVLRLRQIRKFETHHPVYKNFSTAMKKFESLSFFKKVSLLINKTPYISQLLILNRHSEVNEYALKNKSFFAQSEKSIHKVKAAI